MTELIVKVQSHSPKFIRLAQSFPKGEWPDFDSKVTSLIAAQKVAGDPILIVDEALASVDKPHSDQKIYK